MRIKMHLARATWKKLVFWKSKMLLFLYGIVYSILYGFLTIPYVHVRLALASQRCDSGLTPGVGIWDINATLSRTCEFPPVVPAVSHTNSHFSVNENGLYKSKGFVSVVIWIKFKHQVHVKRCSCYRPTVCVLKLYMLVTAHHLWCHRPFSTTAFNKTKARHCRNQANLSFHFAKYLLKAYKWSLSTRGLYNIGGLTRLVLKNIMESEASRSLVPYFLLYNTLVHTVWDQVTYVVIVVVAVMMSGTTDYLV